MYYLIRLQHLNSLWKLPALLLVLVGLLTPSLQAAKVTRVSWDPPNPAYNKFFIQFDEIPKYNIVDSLEKANFFYVDFYGLQMNYKRNLLEIKNDPILKYVDALSFPENDVLRLVFYAKQPGTKYEIQSLTSPPTIVIYTMPAGGKAPATPADGVQVAVSGTTPTMAIDPSAAPRPMASSQAAATPSTTPAVHSHPGLEPPRAGTASGERIAKQHSTGKKYIILDPGHGGANSGAKSNITIGGRRMDEKELTLQFAYELKKLIDTHPGMVGLLTRVDDTNVGLRERVKIAEENRGNSGNLFISLHLNDAPKNPNARGMEVFFLNEKGTFDAATREIEEKENRDIGISNSGSGKSFLTDMMTGLQRDKLQDWQLESYIFCKRLEQSMISAPYFAKHNRGVKSANFVVLKNFEMPAVLLEIGFISHSAELKNMVEPAFQEMTATLVYNAINSYFAENDPSFQPRYIAPKTGLYQ